MTDNNKNTSTSGMGLSALKKAEVVIHTMPKNFLNSQISKTKDSKSTGILILGIGAVLLIALFAGFYYFIVKGDGSEPVVETETSEQEAPREVNTNPDPIRQNNQQTLQEEVDQEVADVVETEEEPVIIEQEEPLIATSGDDSDVKESNPSPNIVKPANDSDQDGLSDAEEKVLGTNILNSDSDGDSFDDFSELKNLYNPAGEGQLLTNSNIRKYTNSSYNYSLYYPLQWKWETIGGDDSVIFKLENNQFIQIIAQANEEKQTIEEWYLEQFTGQPITPEQKLYKKGWTGIKSQDSLIVYLMHPAASHIFTITYNIGITSVTDYKNIFMMMIESMAITN